MKIFLGELYEESCSFAPQKAGKSSFVFKEGEEILEHYRSADVNSQFAGFLDVLDDSPELELAATASAVSLPNGPVKRGVYEDFVARMSRFIERENEPAGVLLALHGAMEVEGIGDGEGELMGRIRDLLPDATPIVASFDLHAVITKAIIQHSTAISGYRTAPHVDMRQTGRRSAKMLKEILLDKTDLYLEGVKLPLIIPGEKAETSSPPLNELYGEIDRIEKENSKVHDVSIFVSDSWVDMKENGMTVTAVAETREEAKTISGEIAGKVWDGRSKFKYPDYVTALEPTKVLSKARNLATKGRSPFVVSDTGDNTTAGAPGDKIFLLRKVLNGDIAKSLFISIVDPPSVKKCVRQGEGKQVQLDLGGKLGSGAEDQLSLIASVEKISLYYPNGRENGARLALVRTGGDCLIVITDQRLNNTDLGIPVKLGIDLTGRNFTAIKNGYLNEEYRTLGPEWALALTPGATYQKIEELDYKNVGRPLYPLDSDVSFNPSHEW